MHNPCICISMTVVVCVLDWRGIHTWECLLEHEWNLDRILEVCVWEYMRSIWFYVVCRLYCGVSVQVMLVREYICIWLVLDVWQMHYGVRVLHLQHGHVFRVVHMKRMLTTLKAYSLHLYVYDRCGVCARLTWLVVKVSTHTHWHARSRTETHAKALRWRKRASLTLSSFLPTVGCISMATNWCHCRTQSSAASAPWRK